MRIINYFDRKVTFKELSIESGLPVTTIKGRWVRGKRDAELVAPPDAAHTKLKSLQRFEAERAMYARRAARQERTARARQELERVLHQPLIDASLVTAEERAVMRQSLGVRRATYWAGEI